MSNEEEDTSYRSRRVCFYTQYGSTQLTSDVSDVIPAGDVVWSDPASKMQMALN